MLTSLPCPCPCFLEWSRDVEAIALANSNMGDYKLKSSPDYEVSAHAVRNRDKKVGKMCVKREPFSTDVGRVYTLY